VPARDLTGHIISDSDDKPVSRHTLSKEAKARQALRIRATPSWIAVADLPCSSLGRDKMTQATTLLERKVYEKCPVVYIGGGA
jgi:hypothetical protein